MNAHRRNRLHTATTMDNPTKIDNAKPDDDDDKPDMTPLNNAITSFPKGILRNSQKHKLLQTQVSTFKGQKNVTMSSNTGSWSPYALSKKGQSKG